MISNDVSSRRPPALSTDVIVIGAGPSGCAAAYDLAARGIQVRLLDRVDFPRPKVCAGGLTIKALRCLRYSITPVIRRTIRRLMVSSHRRDERLLTSVDPICHMVERTEFDDFCLRKTIAAGARFEIVRRIAGIVEADGKVSVVTDKGRTLRSRFLIGADGAHSQVRRLTRRFTRCRSAFAVEGIVRGCPPDGVAMGFDFSQVSCGYGWVFPKDDHINIGLYRQTGQAPLSRQALLDYARFRLGDDRVVRIAGFPLGMGGEQYRPGRGRVLLVGDAAGLAEPLLGEGLFHALSSGQGAARAIIAALETGQDACRLYFRELASIQANLWFSRTAAKLFYGLPRAGHRLLIAPPVKRALMQGFSEGMPLLDIFRYGYRYALGMPVPGRP